jgi:hypothetical protein
MRGEISHAKDLTLRHFPTVLKNNSAILFKLRCQKFVELMRQCSPNPLDNEEEDEDEDVQQMDLDLDNGKKAVLLNGTSRKRPAEQQQQQHENNVDPDSQLLDSAMQEAMAYGQQLQDYYQHDQRPSIRDTLVVSICVCVCVCVSSICILISCIPGCLLIIRLSRST